MRSRQAVAAATSAPDPVRALTVGVRGRFPACLGRGRFAESDREGIGGAPGVGLQALGLGSLPGGLAHGRLGGAGGRSLLLLEPAAVAACGLDALACSIAHAGGIGDEGRRARSLRLRGRCLQLRPGEFAGQAVAFGAALQDRIGRPKLDDAVGRHDLAGLGHQPPARRQALAQGKRGLERRCPGHARQQPADVPARVAPDGVGQGAAASRPDRGQETLGGVGLGAPLAHRCASLVEHEETSLAAQLQGHVTAHHGRPEQVAEGGLDRDASRRVDLHPLGEPPTAPPSRGRGQSPALVRRQQLVDRREPIPDPGHPVPGRGRTAGDGRHPCLERFGIAPDRRLRRLGLRLCRPRTGNGLSRGQPARLGVRGRRCRPLARLPGFLLPSIGIRRAPAQVGDLRLARLSSPPQGRLALVVGSLAGLRACLLGARRGQRGVDLRQGRLGSMVGGRDRQRQDAPGGGDARLGPGPLVSPASFIALQAGQDLRQALDGQARLGHGGPCGIQRRARLTGRLRPLAEPARQGGHAILGRREVAHGRVGLRAHGGQLGMDARGLAGGDRPACTAGCHERLGELHGGIPSGGLLLGLCRQAARLWAQLAEDVAHAGQVRLGLGQPLLGLPAPSLVAPDTGRLLEQRTSLLGAQRERLVDHALADEEEGVVGQVGRVEQVDDVAQPDPLAVEEVLVLAGSEEAPAALDEAVLDRQQPVVVADDQAHVGHPGGVPTRGAGEDDVLGLARAQRSALLAEGPAEGVGEVGLAAPVGADDGADARPELEAGGFRERLEADEAQLAQARLAHPPEPPAPPGTTPERRTASAAAAAAVSASRRFRPSPVPMASSPRRTSTT